MTATIILMAGSYALVAALLAVIVVTARLPLAVKLVATLATGIMITWSYYNIGELRGLPTDGPPPAHFKLHWARVVEPNALMKEKGHVFLWLEELDDKNYPSGTPRAYSLPYDPDLVKKVDAAMGKIMDGQVVSGTINTKPTEEKKDTAENLAQKVKDSARPSGPGSDSVGERYFKFDPTMLTFGAAPAPVTPEKDK